MPTIGDVVLTIAPYLLGAIASLVVFIFFGFSKQRKLRRFLGIRKDSRDVDVYLSSLFIPMGGSFGFDGMARSYQGVAIPINELSITSSLAAALKLSNFDNIPVFVKDLFARVNKNFQPLNVNSKASPLDIAQIDFSTGSVITIGSQGYNIVTEYCVSRNLSQLQISHNGTAISITRGRSTGETIRRPDDTYDIAILERLVDRSHNNATIFIAAGLGVLGTMGATQYLIEHWEELDKKYKHQDFALVLQFGPIDRNSLEDCVKGGVVVRTLPD